MPPFPAPSVTLLDLELMARIALGFLLGGVLGFERERAGRPAGLRTHMMVAGRADAFTVVSVYGFADQGTIRDPSRIAAQVVAGVGFLGAGTIWRTASAVRGLTTAASIWLAAAIGLLVGAGMYLLGLFTALLGYVCLQWLRPRSRRAQTPGEPSIGGAEIGDDESG